MSVRSCFCIGWTAFSLIAASNAALGQPASIAARAQRLAKLEEDLNNPDINIRLATLAATLEGGSLPERSRALAITFSSTDTLMKSVAFPYAICARTSLSITSKDPPDYASLRFMMHMFGLVTIGIKNCDPNAGTFEIEPQRSQYGDSAKAKSMGQISGTDVSIKIITGNPNNTDSVVCSANFTLADKGVLSGTMVCRDSNGSYSSAARINLI